MDTSTLTINDLTRIYNAQMQKTGGKQVRKFKNRTIALARVTAVTGEKISDKPGKKVAKAKPRSGKEVVAKEPKEPSQKAQYAAEFLRLISRANGATIEELMSFTNETWGVDRSWNDKTQRADVMYRIRMLKKRDIDVQIDDKGRVRVG